MNKINELLKTEILVKRKLTVSDAAKLLNISRVTLSGILNGKKNITANIANKLEQVFGISLTNELIANNQEKLMSFSSTSKNIETPNYVPYFFEIKANDIVNYFSQEISGRIYFPVLIRYLILSTCTKIDYIEIHGNDDGQRSGLDGKVIIPTQQGCPWIPDGTSIMEFGTSKDATTKITKDFEKRSRELDYSEQTQITYIAIVSQRYEQKDKWIQKQKSQSNCKWKDIRVYDASDLEQWISQSIPAQVYFLNLIRKDINCKALPIFWNKYSESTKPKLSIKCFNDHIDKHSNTLFNFLDNNNENILSIYADSNEEAIAFVYACFSQNYTNNKYTNNISNLNNIKSKIMSNALYNTIIVDQQEHIDRLAKGNIELIIILNNLELEADYSNSKIKYIRLLPNNLTIYNKTRYSIQLSTISYSCLYEALEDMHCNNIEHLIQKFQGSLTILRRSLAKDTSQQIPKWVCIEEKYPLVVLACLGVIDISSNILDYFIEKNNYQNFEKVLSKIYNKYSEVLKKYENFYVASSPFEVLFYLIPHLTTTEIIKLFNGISKYLDNSAVPQKNIANALAIIYFYHDTYQRQVADIITKIYSKIDNIFFTSDPLSIYAEIKPDIFFKNINEHFEKINHNSNDNHYFYSTDECFIALETIAWDSRYYLKVCMLLVNLIKKANEKTLEIISQKAFNSICKILNPYYYLSICNEQNNYQDFIAIISKLVHIDHDIIFECFCHIYENSYHIVNPNKPIWMPIKIKRFDDIIISVDNFESLNTEIQKIIFNNYNNYNFSKINIIINVIEYINIISRKNILNNIYIYSQKESNLFHILDIKIILSDFINRQLKISNTKANLNLLADINNLYEKIDVSDIVINSAFLFNQDLYFESPELENYCQLSLLSEYKDRFYKIKQLYNLSIKNSFEKYKEFNKEQELLTKDLRIKAIELIFESKGIDGIIQLILNVESSSLVGLYLKEVLEINELLKFITIFNNYKDYKYHKKYQDCIRGILSNLDDISLNKIYKNTLYTSLSDNGKLELLLLSKCNKLTWLEISKLDTEMQNNYWRKVKFQNLRLDEIKEYGIETFIQCLIDNDRGKDALVILFELYEEISSDSLFLLLISYYKINNNSYNINYYIEKIFNIFSKRHDILLEKKVLLELLFIDNITNVFARTFHALYNEDSLAFKQNKTNNIPNITQWIEEQPIAFFKFMIDPKSEGNSLWHCYFSEKIHINWSQICFTLTMRLSFFPFLSVKDDIIRKSKLQEWVKTIRDYWLRTDDKHNLNKVDSYIGLIISNSPIDKDDNIWPCKEVRDIIENTPSLAWGIYKGLINARGAYFINDDKPSENRIMEKCQQWIKGLIAYPSIISILDNVRTKYLSIKYDNDRFLFTQKYN